MSAEVKTKPYMKISEVAELISEDFWLCAAKAGADIKNITQTDSARTVIGAASVGQDISSGTQAAKVKKL